MRYLALDYGRKKTGIAVSDPLRIIATGLTTVPTGELLDWLDDYLKVEEVSDLIVGESLDQDGNPNPIMTEVIGFERKFRKRYPEIQLHRQDEGLTSRMAKEEIIRMGTKKMKRRDKTEVDRVAAALILREWMEEQR